MPVMSTLLQGPTLEIRVSFVNTFVSDAVSNILFMVGARYYNRRLPSGVHLSSPILQGPTLEKLGLCLILNSMARAFSFAPGEFYHLYNRGTEKRNIFVARSDRERFLSLLYFANQNGPVVMKLQGRTLSETTEQKPGAPLVDIAAYCLMPNHFHLLVREIADDGISKFMQKLTTGYTMYFNKRHERSGVLFQGKFKATHVADDRYLRYLISYIHLNPVKLIEPKWKETGIIDKAGAKKYLDAYPYSSYPDYSDTKRPERMILSQDALPEYFSSGADFKTFVTEWLTHKPE
jgi:putative transposase